MHYFAVHPRLRLYGNIANVTGYKVHPKDSRRLRTFLDEWENAMRAINEVRVEKANNLPSMIPVSMHP